MGFNAARCTAARVVTASLLELLGARGADGATPPPHEVERDFRFAGLAWRVWLLVSAAAIAFLQIFRAMSVFLSSVFQKKGLGQVSVHCEFS